MFDIDWRSPADYEPLQNLDTVGLAWEFLRRNPDYRRDHSEIVSTPSVDTIGVEESMRPWGLCFPCQPYENST
jgi:Family of unknown function (DUF6499)